MPLSEVESCGLFGFPKMPGLDRRPTFAQYSGLNEAVATALTYVKAQSTRLMTPIPRLNWFKACWKVDWVAQTWAMTWDSIANQKRKGPNDELTPDLKQVDIKKMRTSSKCKVANAAEDTQTAPEASAGEHMQQPGAEGGDETSVPCVDEASTNTTDDGDARSRHGDEQHIPARHSNSGSSSSSGPSSAGKHKQQGHKSVGVNQGSDLPQRNAQASSSSGSGSSTRGATRGHVSSHTAPQQGGAQKRMRARTSTGEDMEKGAINRSDGCAPPPDKLIRYDDASRRRMAKTETAEWVMTSMMNRSQTRCRANPGPARGPKLL